MKISPRLAVLLACCLPLLTRAWAEDAASRPEEPTASPGPAATAKSKPDASQVDAKTADILHRMAGFYAGLASLRLKTVTTMKVEMNGINNEMTSASDTAMQRPNRFAMIQKSGLMGGTVVSDGTKVSFYSPMMNKYIVQDAPAEVGEIFQMPEFMIASAATGTVPILNNLLDKNSAATLTKKITRAEFIGTETIDGAECDHIKLGDGTMQWDAWVQTGAQPWLRKVTSDMSGALAQVRKLKTPGIPADMKMEALITYKDFEMNPALAPDTFKFTPPEEAKLVSSFIDGLPKSAGPPHPLTNKVAPPVQLGVLGGGQFNLADQIAKGNIVVLDFWATWCPPCVRELPALAAVMNSYKGKGAVFCAVNEKESAEDIDGFLKEHHLEMPVALDADGKAGAAYGADAIPETVLIGKDGKVAMVHVGLLPDLKPTLTAELDSLIAGKPLEAAKSELSSAK